MSALRGFTADVSTGIAAGSNSASSRAHLGLELGVERLDLLAQGLRIGLGVGDVGALLARPADAAGRRRGLADRAAAPAAAEQRAEQAAAHRQRRRQGLVARLRLLALDLLPGAPLAILERAELGGVLLAQRLDRGVALLAQCQGEPRLNSPSVMPGAAVIFSDGQDEQLER